jgi:pimeloyl-ACP methyl ester carboxylesterase
MFRHLIPALADGFRLVAPNYPGYGNSSMPTVDAFEYSFDNLAEVIEKFAEKLGLKQYTLYVQDYGAPVGYRLAAKHPDRVQALVVQNGHAYDEDIDNDFWKPIKAYCKAKTAEPEKPLRGFLNRAATIWQYPHGVRDREAISPDNWNVDQPLLDRPGNAEVQLALFHSYGSNPSLYPTWQAYFRTHQPQTLVVWGKNDLIFPAAGAEPYKKDLTNLEFHLLDTGHFALEEDGDEIADLMRHFLRKNVKR